MCVLFSSAKQLAKKSSAKRLLPPSNDWRMRGAVDIRLADPRSFFEVVRLTSQIYVA